jgi:hypothetical protein
MSAAMSLLSRSIAWILIVTLSSAMTTARLAAQDAASTDVLRSYVEKLPIGSTVKVKMKEGKGVKGTLMVIESDAIVVRPKTRIARPERRLPLREIEFVELQERNGSSVAKAVGIGLATGAGAFFGLMLLAIAIIDD